ncbi:acyl-ACP--UDP-N-acetylglucosamine O-acyltransferase [Thermodesulfobacteriota bacterium]
MIHETAIVHEGARIDESVEVGPYCVIGDQVVIGEGTILGPHVVIDGWTDIGCRCRIFQYASIGTVPQDLKYKGEETRLIIGDEVVIREFATLNRGTSGGGGVTRVGNKNLLMAYCHVAHDCVIGDCVIMANNASLGGHVTVEDYAIIGGFVGVHQFVRIGSYAMIGAMSGVPLDISPYSIASGQRTKLYGLNVTGLKRHGFDRKRIAAIKKAYKIIFQSGSILEDALSQVESEFADSPDAMHMVEFVRSSDRGICR